MARTPQGRFLGIPYNWNRPSWRDFWRDLWDPNERRIFPPKNYGWGWGINVGAIVRRLRGR